MQRVAKQVGLPLRLVLWSRFDKAVGQQMPLLEDKNMRIVILLMIAGAFLNATAATKKLETALNIGTKPAYCSSLADTTKNPLGLYRVNAKTLELNEDATLNFDFDVEFLKCAKMAKSDQVKFVPENPMKTIPLQMQKTLPWGKKIVEYRVNRVKIYAYQRIFEKDGKESVNVFDSKDATNEPTQKLGISLPLGANNLKAVQEEGKTIFGEFVIFMVKTGDYVYDDESTERHSFGYGEYRVQFEVSLDPDGKPQVTQL